MSRFFVLYFMYTSILGSSELDHPGELLTLTPRSLKHPSTYMQDAILPVQIDPSAYILPIQ